MDTCNGQLSRKALSEAFILTYDRVRRYEGAWHLECRLMFPAFVFLESENEENLIRELGEHWKTEATVKGLFRMNPKDEEFLKGLYGDRRHLKMSRGILYKGIAEITEGPLKGLENRICKIDRHKRLAYIQTAAGRDTRNISIEAVGKCKRAYGISEEKTTKKTWKFRYILAGLEIAEKVE